LQFDFSPDPSKRDRCLFVESSVENSREKNYLLYLNQSTLDSSDTKKGFSVKAAMDFVHSHLI